MHDEITDRIRIRMGKQIHGRNHYVLAGNVYNWQVQHNVLHPYLPHPCRDDIRRRRSIIRLQRCHRIVFTVFNNIIWFFYTDY
jgi:hypothetical protein